MQLYIDRFERLALMRVGVESAGVVYRHNLWSVDRTHLLDARQVEDALFGLKKGEVDEATFHALVQALFVQEERFDPNGSDDETFVRGKISWPLVMPESVFGDHHDGREQERAGQRRVTGVFDCEERLRPLYELFRRQALQLYGDLVSQSQAARMIGITPVSVNRRIERGTLKSLRVGHRVYIPVGEVTAAIERKSDQKDYS